MRSRFPVRGVIAACGMLGLIMLAVGVLAQNGQAQRSAANAGRATAPASYPSAKLRDACRTEAAAMAKRLDETFHFVIEPPFVVLGNMSSERLSAHMKGSVQAPSEAMWASYFRKKPTEPIIVLLLDDEKSYRLWAKKLFGDTDVSHFGYFKRSQRTLVMNIATGGGTLVHELTHALMAYDFPDVSDWFNEGLSSLHEQCNIQRDRVVGLVNWRLPGLQKAVKDKTLRPLRELVSRDDFYGQQMGVNYAHARYFCMYMQERGLLKDFYACYRDHAKGEDAAVAAIQKTFGTGIDKVEPEFLQWVGTLKWE